MDEKVKDAVSYAAGSNSLEGNKLDADEVEELMKSIAAGKSDDSFLYTLVKTILERKEEGNKSYGKNKK